MIASSDLTPDSLYQIVFSCPNVNSVEFAAAEDHSFKAQDWLYLKMVPKDTSIWHLEELPTNFDKSPDAIQPYFECAFIMRKSLKSLILTSGISQITGANFNVL